MQQMDIKALSMMSKHCSVLYVEDEEEVAAQMLDFLNKVFAIVVHASNGEEGLFKYNLGLYDLVITDILMPVMDGIEMTKKIREMNNSQRIVVVSASKDMNDMVRLINIGVDGYLIKPSNYDNLVNELGRVLKIVTLAKENARYQKELLHMVEEKTAELKHRYITDELTGLFNRAHLEDILKNDTTKTLLLLDIDNFGFFNDTYGLLFGDKVLKETAKRLQKNLPSNAMLFRVGGDEFAILLENLDETVAFDIALQIRAYFLNDTFDINGVSISKLTFTVGIDGGHGSQMLKNAGIGIKEVRQQGKNYIQVYTADSLFEQTQKENIIWIEKIKNGIEEGYFVPYYQPIVCMKSDKISKYESLARLCKNGEVVMPSKFLLPAKLSGLISGITREIIEKCFRYQHKTDTVFSINISDNDLKEGYLVGYLEHKCEQYGTNPSNIVLEILESVSVEDTKHSLEQLQTLKNMGFKLAIDDFGTESSNFSRLLDLNVDIIKIDGSFIKHIDTDKNSQKITESIVAFAKSMDAEVVAEFVHNEAVYNKIKEYDIDFAQGYYFSEPKPTILPEGHSFT